MPTLSIQDELTTCNLLSTALNSAHQLQNQADANNDAPSVRNLDVDIQQLTIHIELLLDNVTVQWTAIAGSAVKTLAQAQKSIQKNIDSINNVIAAAGDVTPALQALDQIIAIAAKIAAV